MTIRLIKRSDGLWEALDNDSMQDQPGTVIEVERPSKQRTLTQNRALHMWCKMLADVLNDAGLDQMKVLKHDACIPWSQHTVKENLWKPVQEVMLNKASTTEADRKDYNDVHMAICRHLAQKLGITCPSWPSRHGE